MKNEKLDPEDNTCIIIRAYFNICCPLNPALDKKEKLSNESLSRHVWSVCKRNLI